MLVSTSITEKAADTQNRIPKRSRKNNFPSVLEDHYDTLSVSVPAPSTDVYVMLRRRCGFKFFTLLRLSEARSCYKQKAFDFKTLVCDCLVRSNSTRTNPFFKTR